MIMKSPKMPLVLLAVLCLGAILGSCTALSIQSNRRINPGYRRSVISYASKFQRDAPTLFNSKLPTPPTTHSNLHNASPSVRGPIFPIDLRKLFHKVQSIGFSRGNDVTEIHEEKTTVPHYSLLHSLAMVATCRRLSFLILSVSLVNNFRSRILKIPQSNKKMLDDCPWPFTMTHDPIKFVKDKSTHMVVLWVLLCQIYSRIEKARAIIP